MDESIFVFLNGYVGTWPLFDLSLRVLGSSYFKLLPFVCIVWALWFSSVDTLRDRRERLVTVMLLSFPIVATTRIFAKVLPFHARPLHDPGVEAIVAEGLVPDNLLGASSMPSDHAALFFCLATGLLLVSRAAGLFALVHALVVVAFTRVYLGWHWPSDILVGASIGIIATLILFPIVRFLIEKSRVVPFFESRPMLGYPVLFLLTHELALMFNFTKRFVESFLGFR